MNVHLKPPGDPLTPDQRLARKLSNACELARRGFKIAPLQPATKLPYLGESWSNMATSDESQVWKWFADPNREGMNYAVCPGVQYVVLDPDTKEGKEGLFQLQLLGLDAPDFVVVTPSGGQHWYFKAPWPVSNSTKHLKDARALDIDVRGVGGYVVGPGCWTHENQEKNTAEGEYAVLGDHDALPEIGPIPSDFAQYLVRADEPSKAKSAVEISEDGKRYVNGVELDTEERMQRAIEWLKNAANPAIEYEGGNQTTYNTFAWLREHAISSALALALVKQYYNPRSCRRVSPSEDKFVPSPWSAEELERIRDNAYRYAKREVSQAGGMAQQFQSEEEITAGMQNIDSSKLSLPVADTEELPKSLHALSLHTRSGEGVFKRPTRREFIIRNVLSAYGYVGFIGYRGCGKSTVMVDMALRLAHDMDWHGVPMKKDFAAIYISLEDTDGVTDMAEVWKAKNGVARISDRFHLVDYSINLLNRDEIEKVWIPHFKNLLQGRRAVLFVDTWQRATSKGKQNDDDMQQQAVEGIELLASALQGPAVVAAHPPKSDMKSNSRTPTWSGSFVVENHSVALWVITMDKDNTRRFEIPDRIKGARPGFYALFQLEENKLGRNDDWGNPYTAAVVVKVGGEGHAKTLDEQQRQAQAAEDEAVLWGDLAFHLIDSQPDERRGKPMSFTDMAKDICTHYSERTLPERLMPLFGRDPNSGSLRSKVLPERFKDKRVPTTHRVPGSDTPLVIVAPTASNGRATGVRAMVATDLDKLSLDHDGADEPDGI